VQVATIGVIALAVLTPLALSSFQKRFGIYNPLTEEYDERTLLIEVGEMMLSDNPMGVGANNFALVANIEGYDDKAGVAPTLTSRSALIHNIYWLAAAETGYLGVGALLLMLLRPMFVALHCGWRNRGTQKGELLLGLGISLLIVYIHSGFEWIFFTIQVQYLLAMVVGMIAGSAQRLGYWRRSKVTEYQQSQRARTERS
jgi:O-antigen ligase